jgi:hypothetical protein
MSGTTTPTGGAARDLLVRLAGLRSRVAALVELRSADDPTATDPLRGLYVTPERARELAATRTDADGHPGAAAQPGAAADEGDGQGAGPLPEAGRLGPVAQRFDLLAREFGLTELDAHILLCALAPDVDRGFEPLYGYLNDDVGRRRATVALALDLAGTGPYDPAARARFHPSAPLTSGALIAVEDADRPLPGRALRVPERVVAHLLGDDALDPELTGHEVTLLPARPGDGAAGGTDGDGPAEAGLGGDGGSDSGGSGDDGFAARLGAFVVARSAPVYLRERRSDGAAELAAGALCGAGLPVLRYRPDAAPRHEPDPVDATAAPATPASAGVSPTAAAALLREARLRGAALVVGPLPERPAGLVRALASAGVPVVFHGGEPCDPQWLPDAGLLALDAPAGGATPALWRAALAPRDGDLGPAELAEAVAPYRLGPAGIRGAARTAGALAAFDGTPLTVAHIQHSARQQSAPLLGRHARRVRPAVSFADLVLPPEPLELLHELAQRARHREQVLGTWGLRTGGGRGRGVTSLFAGESGTGKTHAAEVVAGALGLDLYVVDLSSVVDKYVGETEKNLERIFVEADHTDAVLLFDEADAVFGKRSDVKSSHDRYANLESAYLLQRLESFGGIAVLTTNLRANIDEAFTRRLDLVVDFPFPDPEQRLTLWLRCLRSVPCAPDLTVELELCAKEFELSGGAIRSAAVTAGYLAAGRGEAVSAADVQAGARREYRKMGRLVPGGSPSWE